MKNISIKIYHSMKTFKIILLIAPLLFYTLIVSGQKDYDVLLSSFVPTIKYPQPKSKQQINIIDTVK